MSERKGTKALELWCKRLVKNCPNVHIENMTTSWRNGIAFCALVHYFKPDLIDLSALNPDDIYHNNQLAFSIAEKQLGIPALLDPEDMVENEVPDRLSILTYLSQFYQRLGHTVSPKYNAENEYKESVSDTPFQTSPSISRSFVKADLDKCTICNKSVYLAQRLIVAHKLYHRRCFRCSKCSAQLSPSSCTISELGSTVCCDSCKNDSSQTYDNNNDVQMGMLAFSEDWTQYDSAEKKAEDKVNKIPKMKPLSVLEKINLFEKSSHEDTIDHSFSKISIKEDDTNYQRGVSYNLNKENIESQIDTNNSVDNKTNRTNTILPNRTDDKSDFTDVSVNLDPISDLPIVKEIPDDIYRTDMNKYIFLQTQLTSNIGKEEVKEDKGNNCLEVENKEIHKEDNANDDLNSKIINSIINEVYQTTTDDVQLVNDNVVTKIDSETKRQELDLVPSEDIAHENKINIPPRLKKARKLKDKQKKIKLKEYPDHLNPFSDDDDMDDTIKESSTEKITTNPFGSSDEDEELSLTGPAQMYQEITPVNPFWSDGEEPASDCEHNESGKMYDKSSLTTSSPNLLSSTPKRKKPRAPPPPPVISVSEAIGSGDHSLEDLASITSLSSHNSAIYADHKIASQLTPRSRHKKLAPTLPDNLSISSHETHECNSSIDKCNLSSLSESGSRRLKGPAPGLPLPDRREVKLQMSPGELQVQMDILETQQQGLERQGVLIEQMIRDRCEGEEACAVPQEEVEDLVIQLCELVNEKNDLFRKHTELMYIRRQQRLEQEQADIEHEIRVIQSRPAVNRLHSDKAREEQLVSRLVEIVKLRDELVQQLDAERRRERQEDLAIATSIANKRAQRNSDSNASSMKSLESIPTPKKSKVKDKVKKQLKKAKHSLTIKKKDNKEEANKDKSDKSLEKEHKNKRF